MVSFQYSTGGPSQYNKRRKNEGCELERKRSMLNALLTINLTLKLGVVPCFPNLNHLHTSSQFYIFMLDQYFYLLNTTCFFFF